MTGPRPDYLQQVLGNATALRQGQPLSTITQPGEAYKQQVLSYASAIDAWLNQRLQEDVARRNMERGLAQQPAVTPQEAFISAGAKQSMVLRERQSSMPHLDPSRGVRGRLVGGQVKPSELSDIDLQAEARVLEIKDPDKIPRGGLEKLVEAQRAVFQQQADAPQMERALRTFTSFGIGAMESFQTIGENLTEVAAKGIDSGEEGMNPLAAVSLSALRTVFNSERNRGWLGEQKAKIRLALPEDAAAAQDASQAVGNFVGPFVPIAAIYRGVGAATGAALGPSWLANAGLRGQIARGAMTGAIWDMQYADKKWVPEMAQWEALGSAIKEKDPERVMKESLGILDTRVSTIVVGAGLDWAFAALGRIKKGGATKDATTPSVGKAPPDEPDYTFDYGTEPQPRPGSGGSPLLADPTPVDVSSESFFGYKPSVLDRAEVRAPGTDVVRASDRAIGPEQSLLSGRRQIDAGIPDAEWEIVPDAPPATQAGPGRTVSLLTAGQAPVAPVAPAPPVSTRPTVETLYREMQIGGTSAPDEIPVPSANTSRFVKWQDTPAARYVRQQGSLMAHDDGSLIVLAHETNVDYGIGEMKPSAPDRLTMQGAYVRDELSPAALDAMEQGKVAQVAGYGETRTMEAEELANVLQARVDWARKEITTLQNQYDAIAGGATVDGAKADVLRSLTDRIMRTQESMNQMREELARTTVGAPMTKMYFGVLRKAFYWDATVPREQVKEIVEVLETNPAFEGFKKSFMQEREDGKLAELLNGALRDGIQLPLGSDLMSRISMLTNEQGRMMGHYPNAVPDLLMATGVNAIHNIGGIRAAMAQSLGELGRYNAWNFLNPRDLVEVFTPDAMLPGAAVRQAAQMTKQAEVMQSDVLADVAGTVAPSDSDVVSAMVTSKPLTTFIYPNVSNLPGLLEALSKGNVGGGKLNISHFGVVPRLDSPVPAFDMIMSTQGPVTPKMIQDYSKYKLFSGMRAIKTTDGSEVEVVSFHHGPDDAMIKDRKLKPDNHYAWVRPIADDGAQRWSSKAAVDPATGRLYGKRVPKGGVAILVKNLAPRMQGQSSPLIERQYTGLSNILNEKNLKGIWNEAASKLNLENAFADGYDEYVALFNELTLEGVHDRLVKQMIDADLPLTVQPFVITQAEKYIFSKMDELLRAPRYEGDRFGEVMHDVDELVESLRADVDAAPVSGVRELAATRGLTAERLQGTQQWMLGTQQTPHNWLFTNEEAALNFLREYNPEVQDLSPGTGALQLDPISAPLDNAGPTLGQEQVDAVRSYNKIKDALDEEPAVPAEPETVPPSNAPEAAGMRYIGPASGASAPPSYPTIAPPNSPAYNSPTPPMQPPAGGGVRVPPPPPPSPPPIQRPGASAAARIEAQLNTFAWNHIWDSRAFFGKLEELLFEAGETGLRPGRDMHEVSTQLDIFHNESQPLRAELAQLSAQFQSADLRQGRVWEAVDQLTMAGKQQYMTAHGFKPRAREAVMKMEMLMDKIHGAAGPRALSQLRAYVGVVEAQLASGALQPYRVPAQLQGRFGLIKHFMDHAEALQLKLEVPNAPKIFDEYIRSYYMDKHVRPLWDRTYKTWQGVKNWQDFRGQKPLAGIADMVLNYMSGIERGFQPELDPMITGVKAIAKAFSVPLTDREVMRSFNWGMSQSYRAVMGFRIDTVLRDQVQPMLAVAYVGPKHLQKAMRDMYGTNSAAAFQNALKQGYTARAIPALVDIPVEQSAVASNIPGAASIFTKPQEARRQLGQLVSDKMRDMLHPSLRETEGTMLDAMWLYTNAGVVGRAIVGNAAEARFRELIAGGVQSWQKLDRASGMDTFEFSRKRLVRDHLTAGDVDKATQVYANTVADMIMLRYGIKEGARGNYMMLGRIGTSLGGYTSQMMRTLVQLGKGARSGSPTAARMAMLVTALYGIFSLMEKKTGYGFSKYNPLNFFTQRRMGGPFFEPIVTLINAAKTAIESGDTPLSGRRDVPYTEASDAAGKMLPLLGGSLTAAYRFIDHTGQSMMSNDPGSAMMGQLLTGEKRDPGVVEMEQQIQGIDLKAENVAPPPAPLSPTSIGPDSGVSDPSRAYEKNGKRVYDTVDRTSDGKVPTHNLDAPSGRMPNESWEQYEQRVLQKKDWSPQAERVDSSLSSLEPSAATAITSLIQAAASEGIKLSVNETRRSVERQEYLFTKGRSQGGSPVTWTLTSNHIGGLAADLRASNEAGYQWIQENGAKYGLRTLGMYDPGHVELAQDVPKTVSGKGTGAM